MLGASNSEAMRRHLDEITTKVCTGANAILILDQAGWHGARELRSPTNFFLTVVAAALTRAQQPREHLGEL
jgi:hypothetical protein